MTYYALKSTKNNGYVRKHDEATAAVVLTPNIRDAATFRGKQEAEFYVKEFKNQSHLDLTLHEIM